VSVFSLIVHLKPFAVFNLRPMGSGIVLSLCVAEGDLRQRRYHFTNVGRVEIISYHLHHITILVELFSLYFSCLEFGLTLWADTRRNGHSPPPNQRVGVISSPPRECPGLGNYPRTPSWSRQVDNVQREIADPVSHLMDLHPTEWMTNNV
jgi:hypothetical protein